MSNGNLQIFKNNELGLEIRTIVNEDGSISVNAEDTARGFGFTTVATSGNEVVRWARVNKYCNELEFSAQVSKGDYIPESLFYMLGMKAKNETALKFQKWLSLDVIPSIRKTGAYITNKANPEMLREKADDIDRLQIAHDSSKLFNELLDQAGLSPDIKLLTAKTLYDKAGIVLPINIEAGEKFYDSSQIAKRLGVLSKSGKPATIAVSQIIKKLNISEDEKKDFFEGKGNWQGTVTKYTDSVINKVSEWIKNNKYPTIVRGANKNYHIQYNTQVVA